MVDGARNALLGYLYQLVGSAAVSIREVSSAADAWAHLIARVGQGEVLIEEFGQDATVRPAHVPAQGVTAIQFKYSATVGSMIARDELIDILAAFDQARRDAAAESVTIEHYAIVTNRQLAPNAEKIVEYRGTAAHPSFTLVANRAGKPVAATTKRLKVYHGDNAVAASAWHTITQSLTVLPGCTFEADLMRLRRFAANYGVLDCEWGNMLNSLLGALIRETGEGKTIKVTREWLKEHLLGDGSAANLNFGSQFAPHIATLCRDRLDQQVQQQHRTAPRTYLEREIEKAIRAELAQHPVVFVAGDGGRGKSLAVANYLRSVADRQLVWSEGAAAASEAALVDGVTLARLPGGQCGGMDRRLSDIRARLAAANGSRRPLWTIDVDGIDEAPREQESQLRTLIGMCWASGNLDASPASVVVTCRSEAGRRTREDIIRRWFRAEPDLVMGVGFVELDSFVPDELMAAARLLGEAPEQRIIRALSPGDARATQPFPAVAVDILRSLQHPVVWGGYATLSPDQRNGVLDGKKEPLDRLAGQLHDRFLSRCRSRKSWRDHEILERALPRVCREITGPPPYLPDDWDRACQSCLDLAEAKSLYNESLSYGIIDRDAGRSWRWSHAFLVDYLATLNGGGSR